MCSNTVTSFFQQQYGFSTWRQSDSIFNKLHCDESSVLTSPIFACKNAPKPTHEHIVAMANEDGDLTIKNSETNEQYSDTAHVNAIFDLAWKFDQMQVVTASGDHSSTLLDIGDGRVKMLRMFLAHNRSVKTVAFQKENSSVLATGSRDGSIILWDTRSPVKIGWVGPLDYIIKNGHVSKDISLTTNKKKITFKMSSVKSVTGLVFQNSNTLISCGAGDGMIKFWDLRKHYSTNSKPRPSHLIPYSGKTAKNGFSNLLIDNSRIKLYANCLDNTIYCYNVAGRNTEPVMTYTGHQNNSFYIKSCMSKDENYLISGSSDGHAYIWNLKHSQPTVKLTGHGAEVTCVSWCNRKPTPSIITCSDDMSYKLWNICGIDKTDKAQGEAEIMPIVPPKPKKRLCLTKTQLPISKRSIWQCQNCERATLETLCENCVPSGSKRKADSNLWSECKRMGSELGPKRLFAHLQGNFQEAEGESFKILDKVDEEPLNLKSLNTALESFKSAELTTSPTVNLPNFVIDGTAPHLNYSPPKRKSQDWLTCMRIERNLRQEMLEKTVGSSPKSTRLDSSPKSTKKPCTTPKSSLLRFFKVTNRSDNANCLTKNQDCDFLKSTERM
ncbi:unnamed protein product [Ceutorhynchus assimilis]|uniref:Denticleless protein homolog n=1 Tax=Ceutorhynchus assimilis TaxID=467358 RepID=A0A9N9QFD2_9CUCU|nr:unnamed protein product [Ceutorhynchus assimilis]